MNRIGDVILMRFPFTDLVNFKLRPAVILADAGRGDRVVCQVTTNPAAGPDAVQLDAADFASGRLSRVSYALPLQLATANRRVFHRRLGRLTPAARDRVLDAVVDALRP